LKQWCLLLLFFVIAQIRSGKLLFCSTDILPHLNIYHFVMCKSLSRMSQWTLVTRLTPIQKISGLNSVLIMEWTAIWPWNAMLVHFIMKDFCVRFWKSHSCCIISAGRVMAYYLCSGDWCIKLVFLSFTSSLQSFSTSVSVIS